MLRLLFFLFLILPLIEIYLLIHVGSIIGAGWTVFLCILSAVAGIALVRQQGFSTLSRVQSTMAHGKVPALEMLEGAVVLVCGVFLLLPGFFTDILAFLGLIPRFRRGFILWAMQHVFQRGNYEIMVYQNRSPSSDHRERPRVIEGESKREDD